MTQRRPQRPTAPLFTPGASGARQSLERSSAGPLLYLRQLPRWVIPIVLAALLVAGFALRGWPGAVVLVVLTAALGWLAALSWPALTPQGRLLRVGVIACVLVVAVLQATR